MKKDEKRGRLSEIRKWWRDHPHIKISPIEKELEISPGTLSKFVNGDRPEWFPTDQIKPLLKLMKRYGYKQI